MTMQIGGGGGGAGYEPQSATGSNGIAGEGGDYNAITAAQGYSAHCRRMEICLQFCQQFPTEFLAERQLVNVGAHRDLGVNPWATLADVPGFDGLLVVCKLPVQRNEAAKDAT